MGSCCFLPAAPFSRPFISKPTTPQLKPPSPLHLRPIGATKTPRGFGSPPNKSKPQQQKQKKKRTTVSNTEEEEEEEEEEDEGEEDADGDVSIPEVVTNRMIQRMGLTVGIPLATGLIFFPLFYYLKVVAKLDVPNWVPLIVSFLFFGTALMGVSYGIVSASWDPLRDGSLLGWNEARRNWPVFWQSLWGRGKK